MNSINYRVSLDMFDVSSQTIIKAKKGDSACKIHITLTENGKIYKITDGCYATFSAKKSDGNFVFDNCTIDGDTIVYDFVSSITEDGVCQISACEGVTTCEVALFNEKGEQLTSPRFTLVIDGTVYNGEEIVSSPEANALKELINEVEDALAANEELSAALADKKPVLDKLSLSIDGRVQVPYSQVYNEGDLATKWYVDGQTKSVSRKTENLANALKGSKSGEVIAIDDVSPIEHNLKVKLSKPEVIQPVWKNVCDMSKMINNYTGLPFENNQIVLTPDKYSGTASVRSSLNEICNGELLAGDTIRIKYKCYGSPNTGCTAELSGLGEDDIPAFYFDATAPALVNEFGEFVNGTSECYTDDIILPEIGGLNATIYFFGGYDYTLTITDFEVLKLEYEVVKPNFETVTVSRYGKNLVTLDGIAEFDKQVDGSYSGNKRYLNEVRIPANLPQGDYKLSYYLKAPVGANTRIVVRFTDGTTDFQYNASTGDYVYFHLTIKNKGIEYLYLDTGSWMEGVQIKELQLEVGSNATPYEEYKQPTIYTPNADGTVDGIKSISPNMTLKTDTGGVTIDVEYNRDINIAFAKLERAILNI